MQHRFFTGINPPKYLIKKTGALTATRLNSTLCRENLSLAGCSSAEPASVSVLQRQNSNSFSIFTTCQKSQPFTTGFAELIKIIDKHVKKCKKETVLLTDEASGSKKFKTIMNHIVIDHSKMYSYKGLNTNTIESFWAIIQRQIIGQHHHVDIEYLDKYVAEVVFKFNNLKNDDMFEPLVRLSVNNKI